MSSDSLKNILAALRANEKKLGDLLIAADEFAKSKTKCKRKGVGVGIVPFDGNLLDFERLRVYSNGPHFDNPEYCSNQVGNCGCVHAEMRAILGLVNSRMGTCFMVSTYAPCTNCANLIATAEMLIPVVIYRYPTPHDPRGLQILRRVGIVVEQMSDSD